jgi:Ulp1 family protease
MKLADLEKIIIPIHIPRGEGHWMMAVVTVNVPVKGVGVYDPGGTVSSAEANDIFLNLRPTLLEATRKEIFPLTNIKMQDLRKYVVKGHLPLQGDGVSCGVLICVIAILFSTDLPPVIPGASSKGKVSK